MRRVDDWWVAQCVEVDVASQGETEEEAAALANLSRDGRQSDFDPSFIIEFTVCVW